MGVNLDTEPGPREGPRLKTSLSGPGVYPVAKAGLLLNPLRALFLPPSKVARRLGLRAADQVLEVGPGPGYFSPTVARALSAGKLTLVDVQPGMLDLARARLERAGLANFECRVGSISDLPFPPAVFDVVFLVTVLGEVGQPDARARAVGEAARVLKPGGLLSITEQFGDPDYVRIGALERLGRSAGLDPDRRFGPRWLYTQNFRKPG